MDFDFSKEPGKIKKIYKKTESYEPLISIIMPFHNDKDYIEQSVTSVLNQTFTDYEILILDDGSTDKESLKKLEEVSKLDDRIKVFHKENEGLSATRDFGVSKMDERSKYVCILDSDDLLEPTSLECFFWALETNKDAAWAYSDSIGFDALEYTWNKYFDSDKMKKRNDLVTASLIRKEAYLEVGGMGLKEKAVFEDWNFWLKLIAKGKFPVKISYYQIWYRRKGNSGELAKARENKKRALKIVRETGKGITKKVEAIQYPKFDYDWDQIVEKVETIPKLKNENDKDKTKILMIVPWMITGGADKFNLDLVKRLDKDKFDVTMILTEPTINTYRQTFENYCTVYDLTSFLDQKYWFAFIDYIIDKNNIDIVFNSNSEIGYAFLPLIKAKHNELPIIDYVHMEEWYNRNGGYSRDSSGVSSVIDKTLTCNENSKKVLIDYFKRNPDEIQTVYIGVDEKEFDPEKYNKDELMEKYKIPENKYIISYICRITEQKRPFLLLQIIKKLKEQRNDFVFLIVGDGNLLNKMKSKAKKLGINDCIMFLGNNEATQEIYKISDMTINCSIKEGLALTSYESLSMGVPVISSDVGGQKELIDEEVGITVQCKQEESEILDFNYEQEEIDEYVSAINKIIKDLDKYKENSRKKILNGFTLDKMTENMTKIFEEVKKNPNKEKIENGKDLEKQKDLCKDLITKTFLEMEAKYSWECMQYCEKMGYKIVNYRRELFKDTMWKFGPYRVFIRFLQKIGVIKLIKHIV